MSFLLPKSERLSSVKEIDSLYKERSSIFLHPLKVIFKPDNGLPYSRIVISVPKRLFKRAVKRNLLKRRLKESYRLNKSIIIRDKEGVPINGFDIMFIYISKDILKFEDINVKMAEILRRMVVKDLNSSC